MTTTERMDRIVIDITTGGNPHPKTDEETIFIETITEEINQAKKKKQIVMVPPEWQV